MRLLRAPAVVTRAALCATLAALPACRHTPPAGPRPPSLVESFDALIQEGCYLSLREVVERYRDLTPDVQARPEIRDRATHAAVYFLFRERELGIPADQDSALARDLVAGQADPSSPLATASRLLAIVPPNARGIGEDASDALFSRWPSQEEQDALRQTLTSRWQDSEVDAYQYLAFVCQFGQPTDLSEVAARFPDSALVRYRAATCRDADIPSLRDLLERSPRCAEARYALGMSAVQEGREAEARSELDAAWTAIPRLTVARLADAELAIRTEDYARALTSVDDVLAVVPDHRHALLVRLQALTYLKRHEEAIALAHELATGSWYLGDVYYLLAWNEYQTGATEAGLADVQRGLNYESSGRVHTLEGLLRLAQARWSDARDAFTTALSLDGRGCDAAFYLGHAEARLSSPDASARAFDAAARCYGDEAERLQDQIADVAGADADADRLRARLEWKRDAALERQRKSRALSACRGPCP